MSQADTQYSDNLCKSAPGNLGFVTDRPNEWDPEDWLEEFIARGGYVTPKGIGWHVRDHEVDFFRSSAFAMIAELDEQPGRYQALRGHIAMLGMHLFEQHRWASV